MWQCQTAHQHKATHLATTLTAQLLETPVFEFQAGYFKEFHSATESISTDSRDLFLPLPNAVTISGSLTAVQKKPPVQ